MKSLRRKPKVLLISFPHNPTTTCVDLDFFREIVRLAREHGTMIIHDFAYADLGFDGYKPPSILQVEGAKDVAVEIDVIDQAEAADALAEAALWERVRGAGRADDLDLFLRLYPNSRFQACRDRVAS